MDSIYLNNYKDFAAKAKSYASQFQPCAILDSCEIKPQLDKGNYKLVIGYSGKKLKVSEVNQIDSLYSVWEKNKSWIFGVLGYNLKNEIEKLSSDNTNCFGWPNLSFFSPETVITVNWNDELKILGVNSDTIFNTINNFKAFQEFDNTINCGSILNSDFNSEGHKDIILEIKDEIINGNVYELNFCSRFLYDKISLKNPYQLYEELIKISPAPFSCYLSLGNKYVLSASPERYLKKDDTSLISQPIKGTRPRGKTIAEDETFQMDLESNLKDRAENVMIVDLVRNDMARIAKAGSVKVEELFGLYSYSHVHQLVSTVSSLLSENNTWCDAIKATFPMGSMTGAPKIASMKWIEKFEMSNREWYSGGFGYIDPNGNMDFNVLIRSIFYDSHIQKLAYYAGGAITIDSECEQEYHEMIVKAEAMNYLLTKHIKNMGSLEA